jgi:hypothetical protein
MSAAETARLRARIEELERLLGMRPVRRNLHWATPSLQIVNRRPRITKAQIVAYRVAEVGRARRARKGRSKETLMRRIPLEQQIAEVAREISLRVAVHPRLISVGTLARLRAALRTLKRPRRKPRRRLSGRAAPRAAS